VPSSSLHGCIDEIAGRCEDCDGAARRFGILYTLAVTLLIAWLLGLVGAYTIGAFVHVLLVIAIVVFVVGMLNGRRPVV
jgi:hypothetical protein